MNTQITIQDGECKGTTVQLGQWVKISWDDASANWWIISGKDLKRCSYMYNPRSGKIETINHDQIVEVGKLVHSPN